MKVLLKEDVDNLGYAGEIMKVADGYGRNYLIPKGLAVIATAGVLKQASVWRDRAAIRMAELQQEHQALAARIDETQLEFTARAGETGKLYGSITSNDIAQLLNETLGTEIDKRNVTGGPLRSLGEHRVPIRLSRDYNPRVLVTVVPFSEEPELEDLPELEQVVESDGELEAEEISDAVEELAGEVGADSAEDSAVEEDADPAEDTVAEEDADSADDTAIEEEAVEEEPDADEPAAEADTTEEDAT
jgi:large subunit ribosomal protein L9